MTKPSHGPGRRRRLSRSAVVAVAGLVLTLAQAGAVQADSHRGETRGQADRELTVVTQNLYLGASLTEAVVAETPGDFLAAVAGIWQSVQLTDFPSRSEALAAEVAQEEPDLIGLQEVAEWTLRGVPTQTVVQELDFLDVLLADLADEGLSYSVAAVSDNAEIGPVPLVAGCPAPACTIEFRDRDVILVNDDTRPLRVLQSASGQFDAQVVLPTPAGPLSFDRGWAYVDARYRGRPFRFLNTHLETDVAPPVQVAQAAELLAGPLAHPGRVIAVGDFNSAADGSTTATYAALTSTFTDAWRAAGSGTGLTCCQNALLANPVSAHSSRIDLVLTRGAVDATDAELFAEQRFRDAPPFWMSDHAGVIADLTLR